MSKKSDVELEQLIATLKNQTVSVPSKVDLVDTLQRTKQRHALRKELEPLFVAAGLDLKKIDGVLKKHQADLERANAAGKAKVAKLFARAEKSVRRNIAARRKGLLQVSNVLNLGSIPLTIESPFLIWADPFDMLVDSHIEPGNSWAKIKASSKDGFVDRLIFYYLWDNPSDSQTLINVSTTLVPKGTCEVVANTGFLSGGTASLTLFAQLVSFGVGGLRSSQSGTTKTFATLDASGGGFWSLETGEVDSKGIFESVDLDGYLFVVPPLARAVFEITLLITASVSDGFGEYDFANDEANYQIGCPYFVVNVLSAPSLSTSLS